MNNEAETLKEDFYEHYQFTVDKGQDLLRIDKFLQNRIANSSRTKIQEAARCGCVLVNGKAVKSNYKVKPLDQISIIWHEPPVEIDLIPENIPVDIVYEDDYLIVVNKQAGMVVHPAYANYTGTLVNALLYHLQHLPSGNTQDYRPGLVHRIDKDTSGLLVVAKTEFAMTYLARQFYEHSIERKYIALVWGIVEKEEGTIAASLIRDPKDRRRVITTHEPEKGKSAITHYRVLERFAYVTLLECRLETGRTHQIRAHLKSIGHPLFNDEMYGGSEIIAGPSFSKYQQFVANCFRLMPRQALHAATLGFRHPESGQMIRFDSELPADFQAVLEKWKKFGQ